MYKTQPFYDWVPNWLINILAVILLLAQNLINGISSYSITEVTSVLGQDAELVKVAFYASSIGLVVMFPFYQRLRQLLQRKKMLLLFLAIELILCIIAPTFSEGWEIILISFFTGAVKCVCLIDILGMLMVRFNPKNSRGVFYGLYYPISFSAGQIVGLYAAYLVVNYEWSFTYYMAVPGILISIAIVLIFMHNIRSQRKVPLYRFDWIGLLLFILFSFSFTAVCIYGERLNWFESTEVQAGTLITIGSLLLFIIREITVRRPYLDFSVLKRYPQVTIGVLLMLIMYLGYNSSGVMSAYMEGVLKYDHTYVAGTSTYMIISFVTVIPLTGWLLSKHYPVRIFLFSGFFLFALYHFISSTLFFSEQEMSYLVWSQILKGTAYGICITTLSYYASAHVDREFNSHRAFFSIATRYVIATPITSAFFTHWLYVNEKLHYTSMSANFTSQNTTIVNNVPMYLSPIAGTTSTTMSSIAHRLNTQSMLLSGTDIYTAVALLCLLIAIAILFIRQLDIHYKKHYKAFPILDA